MARRKKTSAALLKAENRLAGMKSINPKLDLGNGITAATYEKEITNLRQQIADYNTLLSKADEASNAITAAEKQLSSTTEQMLLAVAAKYGKDSSEYEMAGGTRRSEYRRRRTNQPDTPPVTQPVTQPITQPVTQPITQPTMPPIVATA